jgi:hypothetical protein
MGEHRRSDQAGQNIRKHCRGDADLNWNTSEVYQRWDKDDAANANTSDQQSCCYAKRGDASQFQNFHFLAPAPKSKFYIAPQKIILLLCTTDAV